MVPVRIHSQSLQSKVAFARPQWSKVTLVSVGPVRRYSLELDICKSIFAPTVEKGPQKVWDV